MNRGSALFYTDRKVLVIRDSNQLIDYFNSNSSAFCIIKKEHFEKLEQLQAISKVVGQGGGDLIISTKTSA